MVKVAIPQQTVQPVLELVNSRCGQDDYAEWPLFRLVVVSSMAGEVVDDAAC